MSPGQASGTTVVEAPAFPDRVAPTAPPAGTAAAVIYLDEQVEERAPPDCRPGRRATTAMLLLAGANLTLIQFASIKEFAALAGANEVVLLLVITACFLGMSFGYLLSARLGQRLLLAFGVGTVLLHSSLPFSARYLVGYLMQEELRGWVLPAIFAIVWLGITPFYAVFLPRFVDAGNGSARALARLYALEIAGGCLGLAVAVVLTPAWMGGILTIHLLGLVALLLLVAGVRWERFVMLAVLPVVYGSNYQYWNRASLAWFYEHALRVAAPRVLASEFSPYQRVDLLQEGSGQKADRLLYLNGSLLYGSQRLHQHNLLVSVLPNVLFTPRDTGNALVIGGGSLDSARYLAPRVGHLRVVELDETVVRLTRQLIQEPRGGFPDNWQLTIDDGKHFLGNYQGPPFDVISIDIPLPTYVQNAMLYSQRFFELAHAHLQPGGVFSISLTGRYREQDPDDLSASILANRIVAGLRQTFRHVNVIETEATSFAWATDRESLVTAAQANAALARFLAETHSEDAFGTPPLELLDAAAVVHCAERFAPIGEADLQIVMRLCIQRLYWKFYGHSGS